MEDIPYDQWAKQLTSFLDQYGIQNKIVLELGCGTGNMTRRLSAAGFDMIGLDQSVEMLQIAKEKQNKTGEDILYLHQNMQSFELFGTVGAVISVCDSMNYVLSEEELLQTFRLVNNYLDPDGIFIFDIKTKYFYEQVLGDSTMVEEKEERVLIWDNYYDREQAINEYGILVFYQQERGLYRRFEEVHRQKAYDIEQLVSLLKKAGLHFLDAYDAVTLREVTKCSERVYLIAREHGKQK